MTYEIVRMLDPLVVDEQIHDLPHLNDRADVDAIRNITYQAVDRIEGTDLDPAASTAALRDLDFLLSSALRHGADFIVEEPRVERLLLRLGEQACMIPRGTVSTYALANPRGERERSFTGSPEERLFIESVRSGAEDVEASLIAYVEQGQIAGLDSMADGIQTMIDSIIKVKRGITPAYFTGELRPYFEPLTIGGETYAGSGGAQLQFVAVDYLLWGADCTDSVYQDYFKDNVRYLSPEQRELMRRAIDANGGQSLVSLVAESHDKELAAKATIVLQGLKKFRYPHRKLARDNFAIRPQGSVGSGIYTADILDVLLDETMAAIDTLQGAVSE